MTDNEAEIPLDPDQARAISAEVGKRVLGRELTPDEELVSDRLADTVYDCRIEATGRVLEAEGLVVRDEGGWWVPALPAMAKWDAEDVRRLMKVAAESDTLRPRIDHLFNELVRERLEA